MYFFLAGRTQPKPWHDHLFLVLLFEKHDLIEAPEIISPPPRKFSRGPDFGFHSQGKLTGWVRF